MPDRTTEDRIARRIARRKGNVFFRSDFSGLGSPGQVGRAMRALIQKGRLMKIGHGIYVRARPSVLDGKPTPAKGMRELATEALARLGAAVTESRAERALPPSWPRISARCSMFQMV